MRRLARGIGLRAWEVADAAHEAAAQAVLDLPSYRREAGFGTWLVAIARHQQGRRRSQRRTAEAARERLGSENEASGIWLEEEVLAWVDLCVGVRALLAVPERRGFALFAVRVFGVDADTVATVFGCAANAVHQLAHKGAVQAQRAAASPDGPGWPGACGSCRGPLRPGAGGVPSGDCPVRALFGLPLDETGVGAGWEAYRRGRGSHS